MVNLVKDSMRLLEDHSQNAIKVSNVSFLDYLRSQVQNIYVKLHTLMTTTITKRNQPRKARHAKDSTHIPVIRSLIVQKVSSA